VDVVPARPCLGAVPHLGEVTVRPAATTFSPAGPGVDRMPSLSSGTLASPPSLRSEPGPLLPPWIDTEKFPSERSLRGRPGPEAMLGVEPRTCPKHVLTREDPSSIPADALPSAAAPE
jgi:hypothetical protein